MQQRHLLAALAAVAALVCAAPQALAESRDDRHDARRFALAAPDGSSIGVRVTDLTREEAARAKVGGGAAIADVLDQSPAQQAGLKAGDIVVEFDGERVRSARHLQRLVEDTPDGRPVKTVVSRSGATHTLEVTPAARPGAGAWMDRFDPFAAGRATRGRSFDLPVEPGILLGDPRRPRLGVGLQELGDQLAEYFGVKGGVLVASVDPDSPAARAGLKAGDVITRINGTSVSDAEDVMTAIRRADGGATLNLDIVRDRKAQTLKATLPDQPARDRRERLRARRG